MCNSFGINATIAAVVWNTLNNAVTLEQGARLEYLFWMLSYFKSYGEWDQYSVKYGVDTKTFSSWVWYFANLVSKLKVVSTFTTAIIKLILNV
jgi:hypothetical protein